MSYFNYHAKVQKLIKDGCLVSFHFENNYKNIGNALILNFKYMILPVREKWFDYYLDLIYSTYSVKEENSVFYTDV
ncbi:MAG: thermostable hemolysin delta-VPH [Clostridia bacterium]|nr:thermostable hemolysin delta-VPH [Clostridia bacterium]